MLFDNDDAIFAFKNKDNNYLMNLMNFEDNKNPKVLTPIEALTLGNAFESLYDPYKNFKPKALKPSNDYEASLLKVQALDFIVNELNLYLDNYPQDQNVYELFKKYVMEYKAELNRYEQKYDPLLLISDLDKKYEWYKKPWPWDKGGDY